MDTYKCFGELLIANIYKFTDDYKTANSNPNLILITDKTKFVELENFYDNNNLVKIEIDPKISISKNAEKYFKKYNKAKNTLEITDIQKKETKKELSYIESLVYSLDNCKTIQDLDDVYNEISENILFSSINLKTKSNKNKVKENDNSLYDGEKLPQAGSNNLTIVILSIIAVILIIAIFAVGYKRGKRSR